MFGFIKKLFSGILGFFTSLFGGILGLLTKPFRGKNPKGKEYFLELNESQDGQPAATDKAAPSKPVKEEKKPEPAQAKSASPKAPKPEKKTQPVAAGNPKSGQAEPQTEQTFAPKYLMPSTNAYRRRPGPNMTMFRNMAREVKTPRA